MITHTPPSQVPAGERGFTLIELLIATVVTIGVLGSTVLLATQIQQAYSTQLDDVMVQQEARFALDWIARTLRSAGSNPYSATTTACPAAGTPFQGIRIDPNGNGTDDDIRIQADISPPNGNVGGTAGSCTEAGEDITIAYDAANSTITWRDNNTDASARVMTEPVIAGLEFIYLDQSRNVTATADNVVFVQVRVTGRTESYNWLLGDDRNTVLETEVQVRTR